MFFARTQFFDLCKQLFWNNYLVKREILTLVVSLEESNLKYHLAFDFDDIFDFPRMPQSFRKNIQTQCQIVAQLKLRKGLGWIPVIANSNLCSKSYWELKVSGALHFGNQSKWSCTHSSNFYKARELVAQRCELALTPKMTSH